MVSGLAALRGHVGPGVADDLEVDADLREVALEQLRRLVRLLELRLDVDLDRPLHRRAFGVRLVAELLGLLQIVVVALDVLRECPRGCWAWAPGRAGIALQDLV